MDKSTEQKPKQSLRDFAKDLGGDQRLDIEVAVRENGEVVVFHSHAFEQEIEWFEFDLNEARLDFIIQDGNIRDIGLPLPQNVTKYMHNSQQVLMVWMSPETGDAKQGRYVPLITHRP